MMSGAGTLHLDAATFRVLLERQGPSLGLWRAAEVAALREQYFADPVLDLGCGDGLVMSLVLPRVAVGLDPNRGALAQAGQRALYARLVDQPAETAPLPAGSVATVVSNSVLEHLPRLDAALAAAARLLRPGGRLLFTAPTEAFGAWLALPLPAYAGWRNRQLGHLNLWSLARWEQRLAAAGLEVVAVRPYLRRPLVALWDTLELLQMVWVGRRRLVSLGWRRISPALMERLARCAARLDLAAAAPGGGRLIVAHKQ